jgi:hypothetical protein
MRKQTDFDVRVFALGTGAGGESMTHEQVSQYVRDNYLANGWEVLSVHTNQVSAGVIYLQVVLVKWEEIADEVRAKRASS